MWHLMPTYKLLFEVKEPVKNTLLLGVYGQFVKNKKNPHSKHVKNFKKTHKRHILSARSHSVMYVVLFAYFKDS